MVRKKDCSDVNLVEDGDGGVGPSEEELGAESARAGCFWISVKGQGFRHFRRESAFWRK